MPTGVRRFFASRLRYLIGQSASCALATRLKCFLFYTTGLLDLRMPKRDGFEWQCVPGPWPEWITRQDDPAPKRARSTTQRQTDAERVVPQVVDDPTEEDPIEASSPEPRPLTGRWDVPRRIPRARGSTAKAMRTARDPAEVECAVDALRREKFARSTVGPKESRCRLFFAIARRACGMPVYPLTSETLETVAGVLKHARYRSAHMYLNEAKLKSTSRTASNGHCNLSASESYAKRHALEDWVHPRRRARSDYEK